MNRWVLAAVVVVLAVAGWLPGGIGPRLAFGTAPLDIRTVPAGAAASVNGERAGETPLTVSGLRPRRIVLRLEHRYHPPEVRRVASTARSTSRSELRPATFAC